MTYRYTLNGKEYTATEDDISSRWGAFIILKNGLILKNIDNTNNYEVVRL